MDTATNHQRAYFHTLSYMVAEAERPKDSEQMRTELIRLYKQARRIAKLRRVSWDEWQVRQEELLVALMDEQCVPVPEDLRMFTES